MQEAKIVCGQARSGHRIMREPSAALAAMLDPAANCELPTVKDPKFIDDREKLHSLAPVARASISRHVFVCGGKSCTKVGSPEVMTEFIRELEKRKLRYGKISKGRNPEGPILLTECGSIGFCSIGTAVLVYPEGIWYAQVRASDVVEIIENHLIRGRVVERLALKKM